MASNSAYNPIYFISIRCNKIFNIAAIPEVMIYYVLPIYYTSILYFYLLGTVRRNLTLAVTPCNKDGMIRDFPYVL